LPAKAKQIIERRNDPTDSEATITKERKILGGKLYSVEPGGVADYPSDAFH
jgi:hypothetical protein